MTRFTSPARCRKDSLWVYVNIPCGTTAAKLVEAARLVASRLG